MKFYKLLASASLAFGILMSAAEAAEPIFGTGDYVVTVANPTYALGKGPRIAIDEAHHNYQTSEDRFKGFADLMAADGAQVSALREKFSATSLKNIDVLVICNALSKKNYDEKQTINKWKLPAPSAFSDDEVAALSDWVSNGGSLLLISDHMPFPNAIETLAASFGIITQVNFAFDASFTYKPGDMNEMAFHAEAKPKAGILHPGTSVVMGRNKSENIPFVVSFTGSAFRIAPGVEHTPILELGKGTKVAWPSDHMDISLATPFSSGEGFLQGATLNFGYGRVAMFGEASMFSVNYAEWANYYPTGFHNPDAPHNKQFALNVVHWLSGKL